MMVVRHLSVSTWTPVWMWVVALCASTVGILVASPCRAELESGIYVSLRFFDDFQSVYPDDGGGVSQVDPTVLVSVQGDLDLPGGVAADDRGLFVAESTGGIVHVDRETQSQQVVASGPMLERVQDVTIDLDGDLLATSWNTTTGANGVFEVDPGSGEATPVSLEERVRFAGAIDVDAAGNIYVAAGRDIIAVRRDAPDEVVATLADSVTALAWDPVRECLVVGTWRGLLADVDPGAGTATPLLEQDPLNQVQGIAVSDAGEILFNNYYYREDIDGTIIRITTNAIWPGEASRELHEFFGGIAAGVEVLPVPESGARVSMLAALLVLVCLRIRASCTQHRGGSRSGAPCVTGNFSAFQAGGEA